MTQTKKGAFLSMGRLPQLVGQAALAASVLAGGASLLNAGGAMALDCGNGFTYTQVSAIPPVPGTCESPVTNNNLAVGVNHNYNPNLFNTTGTVSYTLTTGDLPFISAFIDADIDASGPTFNFSYNKKVYDSVGGVLIADLNYTNINGTISSDGFVPITETGGDIYVVDSWEITGAADVDNITNTFTKTPGPLPILGAGAAFGFSRKLRGRIKAARLS